MQKVVLVTGCSSGVGLYTAVQFAQLGHTVYATMRDLQKRGPLDQAAAAAGVQLKVVRLDVEDAATVEQAVAEVLQREGRIDVLINNAGAGALNSLEEMTDAEISRTFEVNFFGAIRCIKAVLPAMRQAKSGHVLSVTSVGGLVGQPLNEVYCAAKFALEGLMEAMATYMEPFFGIKFTLVEPAGIKSEFVKTTMGARKPTPGPVGEAYAPVMKAFWDTIQKRGSFETSAQTSEQVAAIIVAAVQEPSQDLRILTSPVAKALTHEKIVGDPTGNLLQQKIRKNLLGLD